LGKLRFFLDVTHTRKFVLGTGIQRVVRSLAKAFSDLEFEKEIDFFLISTDPKSPKKYNYVSHREFFFREELSNLDVPANEELVFQSSAYIFLQKVLMILKRVDFLNLLSSSVFKSISNTVSSFLFRLQILRLGSAKTNRVDFKSGDVLFLADAFWAPPHLSLTTAGEAKKKGARVLLLINDVFPLSRPEYVETSTIKSFTRMLPEALSLADFLVFPSLQTQNELNYFYPITTPKKIIQYGSEKNKTLWLDESQKRVPGSILMVGTIEPRKNHRIVLEWFLSLASPDTKLTIIGQSGWMNSSEVSTLLRETKRNLGLTWINGASDEDLAYEMQIHEIGIMASHAEGLGLPILEYSSHGLKLVLSDIPIFREVAGDVAFFFDGGSVESLDEAIRNAREEKRVLSLPHVSWDNTASDIVAFLRECD